LGELEDREDLEGRWWSRGCSPREEEECGRGRDVGGEVVLEGGDE